jgi:nucleotide-binding universal stress UspA family protein
MQVVTRPPARAPAGPPALTPPENIAIKAVLVASDFSEASKKPLRHAVSVARHFAAKLYLAHVVSSIGYTIAGADAAQLAASAARRELDELENKLVQGGALTGVPHEFIVRQGDVWDELRAVIREKQADLLVLGTHARHGVARLVMGSVAEQIFRQAGGLVLTVGPHSLPDAPPLDNAAGTLSILFPTNFDDASAYALPYALAFANHFKAKLALLYVAPVMPIPEGFSWSSTPSDIIQLRADAGHTALERLRQFVSGSSLPPVTPELMVEFGEHGQTILRVARTLKTDLVIMGLNHSKHGRAISHLSETTAYQVVTAAHCPVLTVRY